MKIVLNEEIKEEIKSGLESHLFPSAIQLR
jgi:hypothetical protein